MKRTYLLYLSIVVLFLLLGFLRDFLFVNINYQASIAYYNAPNEHYMPTSLNFIETWSYKKLYYTKWLLTLVFAVVYSTITFGSIKYFFKQKSYNKITLGIYLLLVVIAFSSYLFGLFFNEYIKGYSIARQIMGLVQSPLVLMILLPAFMLDSKK